MKKLYCLLGGTGVGKNTVESELSHFLQILVNTCTRDIREGEKEGVDYYYINLEEFNDKIAKGEIAEFIEVETKETCGRKNKYGLYKSELMKVLEKTSVISLPLDRYYNLVKYIKDNNIEVKIVPIFIKTDRETRYKMLLERHKWDIEKHLKEILRRMKVDDELFKNIENEIENLVVLENNYDFDSLVNIVKYILQDSFVLSREGGEPVCIEIM